MTQCDVVRGGARKRELKFELEQALRREGMLAYTDVPFTCPLVRSCKCYVPVIVYNDDMQPRILFRLGKRQRDIDSIKWLADRLGSSILVCLDFEDIECTVRGAKKFL